MPYAQFSFFLFNAYICIEKAVEPVRKTRCVVLLDKRRCVLPFRRKYKCALSPSWGRSGVLRPSGKRVVLLNPSQRRTGVLWFSGGSLGMLCLSRGRVRVSWLTGVVSIGGRVSVLCSGGRVGVLCSWERSVSVPSLSGVSTGSMLWSFWGKK